ncbi:MAG: hypothetical protein ABI766_14010 [Gemmatimonadales bacterium]
MHRVILPVALLLVSACGKSSGGGAACGLAALAGPTALLSQFGVEGQTLGTVPARLPERLVARVVAGPALPAIVGRTDASLVIGLEGEIPAAIKPGYGVLVLDQSEKARGVVVYEGLPVEGAPQLGTVSIGPTTLPLIGIQLDPSKIEDPRCPLFPDSVMS